MRQKVLFIIYKELPITRNCLRLESEPLLVIAHPFTLFSIDHFCYLLLTIDLYLELGLAFKLTFQTTCLLRVNKERTVFFFLLFFVFFVFLLLHFLTLNIPEQIVCKNFGSILNILQDGNRMVVFQDLKKS